MKITIFIVKTIKTHLIIVKKLSFEFVLLTQFAENETYGESWFIKTFKSNIVTKNIGIYTTTNCTIPENATTAYRSFTIRPDINPRYKKPAKNNSTTYLKKVENIATI